MATDEHGKPRVPNPFHKGRDRYPSAQWAALFVRKVFEAGHQRFGFPIIHRSCPRCECRRDISRCYAALTPPVSLDARIVTFGSWFGSHVMFGGVRDVGFALDRRRGSDPWKTGKIAVDTLHHNQRPVNK